MRTGSLDGGCRGRLLFAALLFLCYGAIINNDEWMN